MKTLYELSMSLLLALIVVFGDATGFQMLQTPKFTMLALTEFTQKSPVFHVYFYLIRGLLYYHLNISYLKLNLDHIKIFHCQYQSHPLPYTRGGGQNPTVPRFHFRWNRTDLKIWPLYKRSMTFRYFDLYPQNEPPYEFHVIKFFAPYDLRKNLTCITT